MDTGEAEYRVTSLESIGNPILFRTTIGGYHGFYKYGIQEVNVLAPPSANAYYFVSEPEIESADGDAKYHIATIQFCCVNIDNTQRLMRQDQLAHDFDLMMSLLMKDINN